MRIRKFAKAQRPSKPVVTRNREPQPSQRQENRNLQRESNETEFDENLQRIYNDIKSSPSYSSKIADFLRQNQNYSIHRRVVKRKFPRRKIITHYPFQIFQADLIEYSQRAYSYANHGYRFILIVIDSFSKMLYAEPVKRKSAEYMADAMDNIFKQFDYFPNSIITDQGLEFYNSKVQAVFKKYGINHYHTKTKTAWKTPMAERVIRTIKTRLERYFRQKNTKKWYDVLQDVVKNYNRTPHRSIGMAPIKVTFQNSKEVYKRMFGDVDLRVIPRLSVGDRVRILLEKDLFDKGYKQNWSEEIFVIKKAIQKAGVVWYKLEKLDGTPVESIKYYFQLNLVAHASSHRRSNQNERS